MMDARKIDKVDRAVPCSMLNNGGEAANYLNIARRSGRSTFSAAHLRAEVLDCIERFRQ
jgi:hypothetical protein